MNPLCKILSPPIYPALLGVRRRKFFTPELNWMLTGWIEIRSHSRPDWVAIVETKWDVREEVLRCPEFKSITPPIYDVLRRGALCGDRFPIIERCQVTTAPLNGALIWLNSWRYRPWGVES
jgi:hypothetical protein